MQEIHKLKDNEVKAIEEVLAKGDRVELIPVKDGETKILHIKRRVVKTDK